MCSFICDTAEWAQPSSKAPQGKGLPLPSFQDTLGDTPGARGESLYQRFCSVNTEKTSAFWAVCNLSSPQ